MSEQNLRTCPICGAAVADDRKHTEWHAGLMQDVEDYLIKRNQSEDHAALNRPKGYSLLW